MYRTDFTGGLDTEGPFGLRMRSKAAAELEAVMSKEGVKDGYRHYVVDDLCETSTPERTDLSWITIESPDREREVILTDGINDAIFKQNGIVTINHNLPAVGKNVWLKKKAIDGRKGMIALTKYLERPEGMDKKDPWIGDRIFGLVVQKALTGKSVGILPVPSAVRGPTAQEVDANPDWDGCKIYERSYLVEYAVCRRPVHPEALVVSVQKAFPDEAEYLLPLLGVDPKEAAKPAVPPPEPPRTIQFVPLTPERVELIVKARLAETDWDKLGAELMKAALFRKTGVIA